MRLTSSEIFYYLFARNLPQSKNERILKIAQHLAKVRGKNIVASFFETWCTN